MQQAGALHVLVPVHEADVPRTGEVRLLGDGTGERRVDDVERGDDDVLARRDVRADADGEAGKRTDSLGHGGDPRRRALPLQPDS